MNPTLVIIALIFGAVALVQIWISTAVPRDMIAGKCLRTSRLFQPEPCRSAHRFCVNICSAHQKKQINNNAFVCGSRHTFPP